MSRRIDLSLFRGDDSDEDDGSPLAKAELNPMKSKTLSYGVTKKTKRDLELEAERKKRQEEEEATKLALEEYSQAFSGSGHRAPASSGGWKSQSRGFVRAGDTAVYNPPHGSAAPALQASNSCSAPVRLPSPPPPPKPRGKRAMDAFLEEIKGNQEAREARLSKVAQREGLSVSALAAYEGAGGKRSSEQETTNLFVVNLPFSVTEESLGNLFAKMGPVGTVKIMWPRPGDEDYGPPGFRRAKPGLTGFVAFMKRSDAEKALRKYDGHEFAGSTLRVSWGKPVSIPHKAAFEQSAEQQRAHSPPRRRARSPDTQSVSPATKKRRSVSPDGHQHSRVRQYWVDSVPPKQSQFLQAVAERIKSHGEGFKSMLMEREIGNPQFAFLFDDQLPEYHVFRHYQDPLYRFPAAPVQEFDDEGYASIYSSDSAEELEQEEELNTVLGALAHRRFGAILRGMSGKRVEIARAMEFAVKRAEAAEEVVNMVIQSLCIDNTPIPRKIARLHLISDILHNSASPLPNVWRYRQAFEKRLPAVFAHFADVYNRLLVYSGTISADVFRQQADAVLAIWERWIVFTADVHESLKSLLHGLITLESLNKPMEPTFIEEPTVLPAFKSAGFKSSFKRVGALTEPVSTAPPLVPTASQHNGDVNNEPVTNIDGKPMGVAHESEEEEDLDGDAMDDDVDGEELDSHDVDGEAM